MHGQADKKLKEQEQVKSSPRRANRAAKQSQSKSNGGANDRE